MALLISFGLTRNHWEKFEISRKEQCVDKEVTQPNKLYLGYVA